MAHDFHDHHHHHHHSESRHRGVQNISIALVLNVSFAAVELIGGFLTSSTAIQADAIHDMGDSAVLASALLLQWISRVPPARGFTFGLKRLSLVSALVASLMLFVASAYVFVMAIKRVAAPETPHLPGMFVLALLGVAVNGFAAWRLIRGSTQNEKAIAWHMLEDLLGWVAVLISSIVMYFVHAPWLDPLLAAGIGAVVCAGAVRNFWASFRLFLQAVPSSLDEMKIRDELLQIPGVKNISSLQIWSLDGDHHVATMRVETAGTLDVAEWLKLRAQIAQKLLTHQITDLTVEPMFILDSDSH